MSNNFNIKKFLVENKLTSLSKLNTSGDTYRLFTEEAHYDDSEYLSDNINSAQPDAMPAENTDIVSEVEKYLNLESADDIISEIERDVTKTTMEAKLQKIKEVIQAIDEKANSLEEDSSVKDYVNPSKIREMRRTTKKLRSMQDRLVKEYDKKFAKTKKKASFN